jgi:predicted transcriptional regulator
MPRKPSPTLTDGETRLMNVLWQKGQATVSEVVDSLPQGPKLAYTTVQTMLRILEAKGFATHAQVGRAFVYRPAIAQREARRGALRHLLSALFDNSPSQLVLDVLNDEQIDRAELTRLKKLIQGS